MASVNLDSIKLSQLRALVAVADKGNFSEAALHLEISQSAVSHAIATLETELGVVLLSRGRHGARLTPVGELITAHAQEMLTLLERIGREATLAKGLESGQVRISSIRSVATHILPDIIAKFTTGFPGINISIGEYRGDDGVEQALREGRADIGFTCMPAGDEFETWELFRDEYLVLMPPNTRPAHQPLTWPELAQYPLILPPSNDYCSIIIRSHLGKLGYSMKAAYEIHEDSTIVGMVGRGLGVSIMAKLAAEPLPSNIQVFHLPVPLERTIRVMVLREALHPPAVYAFLDILKEIQALGLLPLLTDHRHRNGAMS